MSDILVFAYCLNSLEIASDENLKIVTAIKQGNKRFFLPVIWHMYKHSNSCSRFSLLVMVFSAIHISINRI